LSHSVSHGYYSRAEVSSYCAAQAGLKLQDSNEPPASVSRVAGQQVCAPCPAAVTISV
jgi:hypothetical protein